jgi:hypothetical protein
VNCNAEVECHTGALKRLTEAGEQVFAMSLFSHAKTGAAPETNDRIDVEN